MSDENITQEVAAEAPVETNGQPEATQPQTEPVQDSSPVHQPSREDRYVSQINGMRPLVEPLTRAGIRDPQEVQDLLSTQQKLQALSQKGIDLDTLLSGADQSSQETQPAQQPQVVQPDEISRKVVEILGEREAIKEHETAEAQAVRSLEAIAKEIGQGHPEDWIDDIRGIAVQYMQEHGQRYPIGHPMHDKAYYPPTESDISQIKQLAMQKADRKRGAAIRNLVDDQVMGQSVPSNASSMAGQDQTIPSSDARKARFQQLYQQNLAQLSGDTLSNA